MLEVTYEDILSLSFVYRCYLVAKFCLTVALQAPLSMGFPRQESWNELLFPSPRDLPNPGIEHTSPHWLRPFKITDSISLLVIDLFMFSISFWLSLGTFYISRNLFLLGCPFYWYIIVHSHLL